jgi:hypothetical protein
MHFPSVDDLKFFTPSFKLVQHQGDAPGVATVLFLFPYDGFGIVLLANTAATVHSTIALAVADRILGLPKISQQVSKKTATNPLAPFDPPLPIFSGFTGTYSSPGYGNFTLCSPLFPTSRQCLDVVHDFRTVDSAAGNPTPSLNLFSAWPRFWGSHFRLSPVSGNDYAAQLTTLYVDGYGADSTPFEDVAPSPPFKATFMVEDGVVAGLGFFVAEQQSWRAKKGGSVRDIADVWFDKI